MRLRLKDAAEQLGVRPARVHQLIKDGGRRKGGGKIHLPARLENLLGDMQGYTIDEEDIKTFLDQWDRRAGALSEEERKQVLQDWTQEQVEHVVSWKHNGRVYTWPADSVGHPLVNEYRAHVADEPAPEPKPQSRRRKA